jgi:hypothetical protein
MKSPESPDTRETVAICLKCGKTAFKGGSDATPGGHTPDISVASQWPWCAFGEGWTWCCTPPTQFCMGGDPR